MLRYICQRCTDSSKLDKFSVRTHCVSHTPVWVTLKCDLYHCQYPTESLLAACVQQTSVDLESPLWIALGAKNKKYRRLLIAPLDQFNRAAKQKESCELYARFSHWTSTADCQNGKTVHRKTKINCTGDFLKIAAVHKRGS